MCLSDTDAVSDISDNRVELHAFKKTYASGPEEQQRLNEFWVEISDHMW